MAVFVMKDLFTNLFGKPEGIVLFQLLEATQFTIYLSFIAFIGGGLIALILAFMATIKNPSPLSFRVISDDQHCGSVGITR